MRRLYIKEVVYADKEGVGELYSVWYRRWFCVFRWLGGKGFHPHRVLFRPAYTNAKWHEASTYIDDFEALVSAESQMAAMAVIRATT